MNLTSKTLDQIRAALDSIEEARADIYLNRTEKTALEAASVNLRNMERTIIRTTETELVEALTTDSNELKGLVSEINASVKHLEKVAVMVEKASKTVEALISIMIVAGKAGLL